MVGKIKSERGEMRLLDKRITGLRKAKHDTQEELAKKLEITRSALSQYELGTRNPDYELVKKMAAYFDVTTDYLLGITADMDPVEKFIKYLEYELTDEEIINRVTFKVDNLTLSNDEIKEFIAFVRAKRFMKKEQPASASKSEELVRGQD